MPACLSLLVEASKVAIEKNKGLKKRVVAHGMVEEYQLN